MAAASALVLTACGGGDDDDSSSSGGDGGSGGSSEAAGPIDVTVTSLNLCDELYVYYGIENGVFAEHDLNVETVQSTGGAAALAALQSGDVDVAFANPFSIMLAEEQGIDLTIISGAYNSAEPPDDPAGGVAVPVGSDIQGPEDMAGKTMAVNELGGINQIMTEAWIRDAGGDPSETEFVALPFPELAPALINGDVDAANLTAGAIASNADKVELIGNPQGATEEGYTVFATYASNTSWLDDNPEAATRWHDAFVDIQTALEDEANLTAARELATERCGVPAETLASLPSNSLTADVDMAVLEEMAQLGVDAGVLSEVPDVESLVAEDARG
ncbi:MULTISPECIES: ABC transporter substrate-binding protein [unclassified Blastococcus]